MIGRIEKVGAKGFLNEQLRVAAEQYACLRLVFAALDCFVYLFPPLPTPSFYTRSPIFCRYKTARANLFSIISTFRRSDPLMRVFREKADEVLPDEYKFLGLMEPVPTRWVYEYVCVISRYF